MSSSLYNSSTPNNITLLTHCYWDDVVDKNLFCESTTNDGGFETENTISNAAYFIFSMMLMYQQSKCYPTLKNFPLTSLLFINAFGSTFYHAYKTRGWGTVDGSSMLMLQAFSIYFLANKFEIKTKKAYWIRVVLNFTLIGFTLFAIISDLAEIKVGLDDNRTMFDILFASVATLNCVLVLYKIFQMAKKEETNILFYVGIKILVIGIIGSVFWLLTEQFCDIFYSTHGHILWHILSAFVAYHLIIFVTYCRLDGGDGLFELKDWPELWDNDNVNIICQYTFNIIFKLLTITIIEKKTKTTNYTTTTTPKNSNVRYQSVPLSTTSFKF